ncbi:MFS transporter [Streptacidiphilus sp. ASG 303]|uniref:MFS transporter n=1 Tax=Streptacidiphilus sp. ASG 303 TaxID=2896847 RepID=UPI001E4131FB|nr:MFS transporter [Streptacidiphilus sp. ASG 303]MCD0482296.1 MFS transporter [Streptacidiphilus sp. ASG 303]
MPATESPRPQPPSRAALRPGTGPDARRPGTGPDARRPGADRARRAPGRSALAGAARSGPARTGLLLAGIVLVALNMRACLAAVSPMAAELQRGLGLSSAASGLVTAVPVLFQGAGAPLTPRLVRRHGTERVVLGAVLLLAAGVLLRVLPAVAALYAGCVVIGVAISVLNVAMPGLIKREFPERAAAMTGVYSTAMLVGATLAAAVSVPLEHALGGWRASLGSWSVLALVAAAGWLPQLARGRSAGPEGRGSVPRAAVPAAVPAAGASAVPAAAPSAGVWRSRTAWQVSVFMGISSLLVYSLVAWMPTILADGGMDRGEAGLVFASSNLVQVAGAFLVPLAAGRMRSQRGLAVAMASLNAAGIAGLLAAPAAGAWLWALLIGVAQGGSLGLGLSFIVLRARGAAVAARLSGMTQTVGYLVAAAGPVAAGALRQATGGWTVPLGLMLALCAVAAAAGFGAGRDRVLG